MIKTRTESRPEDMSRDGYLELMQCEDGDIHVTVRSGSDPDGHFEMTDIEFTLSGGHSHHTIEALRHLMDAMKRDNDGDPWPRKEDLEDDCQVLECPAIHCTTEVRDETDSWRKVCNKHAKPFQRGDIVAQRTRFRSAELK